MMVRQGLRFLLVGGFNTALTYGLYCLLVIWWHAQIAWLTVFLLGLCLGYLLHSRFVFAGTLSPRKALNYAALQLLLYGLSSATIFLAMREGTLGPRLAGALAIAINVPISFALSRLILSDRAVSAK